MVNQCDSLPHHRHWWVVLVEGSLVVWSEAVVQQQYGNIVHIYHRDGRGHHGCAVLNRARCLVVRGVIPVGPRPTLAEPCVVPFEDGDEGRVRWWSWVTVEVSLGVEVEGGEEAGPLRARLGPGEGRSRGPP